MKNHLSCINKSGCQNRTNEMRRMRVI